MDGIFPVLYARVVSALLLCFLLSLLRPSSFFLFQKCIRLIFLGFSLCVRCLLLRLVSLSTTSTSVTSSIMQRICRLMLSLVSSLLRLLRFICRCLCFALRSLSCLSRSVVLRRDTVSFGNIVCCSGPELREVDSSTFSADQSPPS